MWLNILIKFKKKLNFFSPKFRWIQATLGHFRLKSGESVLNSGKFSWIQETSPKLRQKCFRLNSGKNTFAWKCLKFFFVSWNSLSKNDRFRTLSPTFRRFRLNSGRLSWNVLNSGNFLLKVPNYRIFQEKKKKVPQFPALLQLCR